MTANATFAKRRFAKAVGLVSTALATACTHTFDDAASTLGFDRGRVRGADYSHVTFVGERGTTRRLHVYLDGDGRPWVDGTRPAADPTPADPLVLELMARDPVDTVYLGRPCYFELAVEPGCSPDLWTFARYSRAVVSSMASAANRLIAAGGYTEVVLIGYSGGGAVARLMAPDVDHLRGLLTVAANLDTDAWSAAHGYLPLVRSLNPATVAPLAEEIVHVAVVGERDAVVPLSVVDAYLAAGQRAEVWRYAEADHSCCWAELWSEMLARFEQRLGADVD